MDNPQATPPQNPPAQQQPTGQQPPSPQQPPPGGKSKISFDLDPRTKATIQWSAIWFAVGAAIENVFGFISFYFMGGVAGEFLRAFGGFFNTYPFGILVQDILWGAVSGAIAGFILSKFYTQIQEINKKYLKGKLDTFFKLLFYPSLVGAIIGFLLVSGTAYMTGLMPIIIIFAGVVLSSFVYAKMLSGKVGNQYPSPAGGAAPPPSHGAPPTQPPAPPQQPPTPPAAPPAA